MLISVTGIFSPILRIKNLSCCLCQPLSGVSAFTRRIWFLLWTRLRANTARCVVGVRLFPALFFLSEEEFCDRKDGCSYIDSSICFSLVSVRCVWFISQIKRSMREGVFKLLWCLGVNFDFTTQTDASSRPMNYEHVILEYTKIFQLSHKQKHKD